MLKAIICESKYPRKGSEFSCWLVRGKDVPDQMLFTEFLLADLERTVCVHPATSYLAVVKLVQQAFNTANSADSEFEAAVDVCQKNMP